jgi:dienelactone hydrolase
MRAPSPPPVTPTTTPTAPPSAERAPATPSTPAESAAAALVGDLARGAWAAAEGRFDPAMASAMPEAKLAEFWQHLVATQGDWVQVDRYSTETKGGYAVALLDARFARRRQRLRVSVDAGGRIAGIFRGPVHDDAEQEARAIVDSLARGDGERATRAFGAEMRGALPAAKLLETWNGIVASAGAFEGGRGVTFKNEGRFLVASLDCHMHDQDLVARVVFDADGDVAGLFFRPPEAHASYTPPAYVDPNAIEERDVQVGSAPALPGTLTVPKNARAVPGAVLVHGSGPNGRDEDVAGTLVFRDIALGLATRGIAVLRYDKRSRVDPRGVVTQKEEVLDGALAAIDLLRKQPEVDPARVVVVGHSEGGALAPRIAQADGRLAGIAVLAGPTRTLQDLMIAQLRYLTSLDPANAKLRDVLSEAIAFKAAVEDPALKPEADLRVPGGGQARGAYFLDARGYHPERAAAALPCAVLVVQGGRDYQVTMADDFDGWRHALSGDGRATLKTYPALDHRLVAGQGPSSPDQYRQPGHVDEQLVADVAAWITKVGAAPAGGRSAR